MGETFILIFDWEAKDENKYLAFIGSMGALGALFGTIFAGLIIDHGRRKVMLIFNSVSILGCFISCIQSIETVCLGRFIFGFAAGTYTVIVPTMISEIVPLYLFSIYGNATNIGIGSGMLMAFIMGFGLGFEGTEENFEYWRIVFLFPALVCIVQVIGLVFFYPYDSLNFLIA